MTCPRCQRGLAPVDMFCGFCGARADAPRASAAAAAEALQAADALPAAEALGAAEAPVVEPETDAPPALETTRAAPVDAALDAGAEEPDWAARAEPAGFWIRGGAFAVDAVILAVWMGVIWGAVVGAAVAGALGGDDPAMLLAAMERTSDLGPTMAALFGGVLLAYLVAFVVFEGATPGKMLFRLHVLGADGPRVGMARALAREGLGRLAVVLTLGVGFVLVAFSASRRGLHDLIARTRVVRLPEGRPAEGV